MASRGVSPSAARSRYPQFINSDRQTSNSSISSSIHAADTNPPATNPYNHNKTTNDDNNEEDILPAVSTESFHHAITSAYSNENENEKKKNNNTTPYNPSSTTAPTPIYPSTNTALDSRAMNGTVTNGKAAYEPPPVYAPKSSIFRTRRHQAPSALGAIHEDGGMAPDTPKTMPTRPMQKLIEKLRIFSTTAPKDEFEDVTGPNGEKFSDVRANKGGNNAKLRPWWRRKRWIFFLLLLLLLIIGLAVGLGVGLTVGKKSSSSSSSSSTGPPLVTTFPAGSYSITTFLAAVSTACTPDPSTWSCFPYQTYNQSQNGSVATFNWIITGTQLPDGNANFTAASSANPFAPSFPSTPVTLQNSGTPDEHYEFTVSSPKVVRPDAAITLDGLALACTYNNSLITARLYTKKYRTYPPTLQTPPATNGQIMEWPYAVDVVQYSNSSDTIPYCQKIINGIASEFVDIGNTRGGSCQCNYMNYGT